MNLSSILVVVLIVVLISLVITFIVLRSLRPSILQSLTPKSGELNQQVRIGTAGQVRDLFMAPASSTLIVYVKCVLNGKTPTVVKDENPMRIGSALQLQIVTGSSAQKQQTFLVVRTQNKFEKIPLMDFPEQQWVHTAIVREGRRYTVYYNGKVAGSSRTMEFPTINASQFIMGDSRIRGLFAFPKLAPTAYHLEEIKKDMETTSDTRHQPYLDLTTGSFFDAFSCPGGVFCFSTSSQPRLNPLKTWKTPYA